MFRILGVIAFSTAVAAIPLPRTAGPAEVKDGDVITVANGSYADVQVAVPAGTQLIARFNPQPTQVSKDLPQGRFIFKGVGKVYVNCTLIDFDKKAVTQLDFAVQFGPEPAPPPKPVPPPPGPGPGPAPPGPGPSPPNGQVSFFIVAEDTTAAGAWRGQIMGSPKVESFYRALKAGRSGPIHRLVDVKGDLTDPVAAWAAKASAGKQLPYMWLLDSAGALLKECPCPISSDDAFIAAFDLHADQPRAFGLIKAAKKLKWTEFGTTPQTPLIPREQWKDVTLQTFNGPVRDQDGRGQCVPSSTCSALEACRNQLGLAPVYLSAGDLYSNINGGRDNGAILEDSMAWVTKNGVCTTNLVPYVWNGRRATSAAVVAERKLYIATEVYICPTFDAAASAVQQGFHLVEALTWYNSYMRVDSDGWLPGPSRGVAGGHALHGYGLKQRNGKWGIATKNSWNTSFGGSKDGTVPAGCCVIPESNFDDVPNNGFFAVRAVVQNPTPFPTPKFSLKP